MEWLIRNIHQCPAVRTNSRGHSGFPSMLSVIFVGAWVLITITPVFKSFVSAADLQTV